MLSTNAFLSAIEETPLIKALRQAGLKSASANSAALTPVAPAPVQEPVATPVNLTGATNLSNASLIPGGNMDFLNTPNAAENISAYLSNLPPVQPSAADTQAALAKQILGQNLTSKWSGEGFGSAQANAADMAKILSGIGITDIKQFGQIPKYEPLQVQTDQSGKPVYGVMQSQWLGSYEDGGYQEVFTPVDPSKVKMVNGAPMMDTGETTYGNKVTGQAVPNTYSERQTGNAWGGTFAGSGNTGYRVQFGPDGTPYFYTTGASSNDLANILGDNPILNIAANLAAATFGGPLGSAALQLAQGKDLGDAAKAALLTYGGQQITGGLGDSATSVGPEVTSPTMADLTGTNAPLNLTGAGNGAWLGATEDLANAAPSAGALPTSVPEVVAPAPAPLSTPEVVAPAASTPAPAPLSAPEVVAPSAPSPAPVSASTPAAGALPSTPNMPLSMRIGTTLGLEGTAANVVGNALLQGTLAEVSGGDFVKGAISGGAMGALTPQQLGGLVTESLSNAGIEIPAGSLAQKAIGNAIYGTVLNGGDVEKGIKNAVASYAGDKVATSTEVNNWLKDSGITGTTAAAIRGGLAGGVSSGIRGQDILTGAVSGAGATAVSLLSQNYLEDKNMNPQTAAALSKAASTFAASKLSGATDYNAFVAAALAAGSASVANRAVSDINKIPVQDFGDQLVIKSSVSADDLQNQAETESTEQEPTGSLPSSDTVEVTAPGSTPEAPLTAAGASSAEKSAEGALPAVTVTDTRPVQAPLTAVGDDASGSGNVGGGTPGEITITSDRPVSEETPVTGVGTDDTGTVPSRVTTDSSGNLTITADRPVTTETPVTGVGADTPELVITGSRPTPTETPEIVITADRPVTPELPTMTITADRPMAETPVIPTTTTTSPTTPAVTPMPPVSPPASQPSTPSGGLPTTSGFSDQKLDSSPQFLAGATSPSKPAELAKLQQLYSSLTPALAGVLASRGFAPQQEAAPTQIQTPSYEVPQDFEELAAQYGYKPEAPKFFAEGGKISESQKVIDSMMPKFTSAPSYLAAAPQSEVKSRLGALTHLNQGILRAAKPLGGLAQGGLPSKYAEAAPKGHKPEFITGLTGYYAQGDGTGQSDDIPAMLHDGDYVIDAEAVSALGDGSSKAGAETLAKFQKQVPHRDGGPVHGKPVAAKIADGEYVFPEAFVTALGGGDNKAGSKLLDGMREELREHKRSASINKIPPKAKSPLDYLKMAKG